MNMRVLALAAAFLAAVAVVASHAQKSEQWYVVEIMGSPVGFASEVEEHDGDAVVLRTHMDLEMSRMGAPLSMFMAMEEVSEAASGRFESARMEMTASVTGMSAWASLDGDTLDYRFETAGSVDEQRIPWDPDAVSQAVANERMKAWLRGDEPEFRFTTFRVDEGEFIAVRVVRKGTDTRTVDGEEQTVIITEEYENDAASPLSTTEYDEDLVPYRTVMTQMGLEIVVRRVSEEEMASVEVDPNFDIIRQSMIPVSGYPDPPSQVQSVTMRLVMPKPVDTIEPLDGPNQKEIARGEHWIELRVTRDDLGEPAEIDREVFLAPDRYIQSEHPRIVAIADSIRGASGKSGLALAREIARWVNGYITQKNYGQGFASALEVCETRSGDCTEHSMLLTAVLRAAGIPARPVVGLAYAEGQFVGHMWAEAYIDGAWHTLDALDLDLDPIRIRVSASEGEAVDHRALMEAYAVVGGMRVEVVGHQARAE